MKADNLLKKMDKLPPYAVRVLARHKGKRRALTTGEIAKKSGLSPSTVKFLSRQRTWDRVTVGVAVKFSEACGVDLLRQKRSREYLRVAMSLPGGLAHILKLPNKQYFINLMKGSDE
jgi:hypothetical protein